MKLAIMQPYFFPYLGYFQLIIAVDKFIFYDDVNFIKKGWVNRNRIITNNLVNNINLGLIKASQNKKINEINIITDDLNKTLKTIQHSYSKAPFFKEVYPMIENYFLSLTPNMLLSEATANSILKVCQYLGISKSFEYSSEKYPHTRGMERGDRLMAICHENSADNYINPLGGTELYNKEVFKDNKIVLQFLKPKLEIYQQWGGDFIPGLSIIDVLMFNSKTDVNRMLNYYDLL